jgi:hypothetical protein
MRLSVADIAWAAGIIDGEGCVSMTRSYVGTNRRVTESFQIRLRVRMTDRPTIRRLHAMFGGTFNAHAPQNPRTDKPSFLWACHDLVAARVLKRVLPYMLTKRRQGVLALRFVALRLRCGRQRDWPGGRCPQRLVSGRRRLFEAITQLNRRGP